MRYAHENKMLGGFEVVGHSAKLLVEDEEGR